MENTPRTVACIGCGRMARALITGWLHKGVPPTTLVVANPPNPDVQQFCEERGLTYCQENQEAVEVADTVLLCVKPAKITSVCRSLFSNTRHQDQRHKIVISVADTTTPLTSICKTYNRV